jgi:ABC-type multidrug transport system ATPase subunit
MTAYALTLSGISSRAHGLDGISLAILPGEIVAVVGPPPPPRAGKTALLRIAAGSLRADAGEARVYGIPASDPAARRLSGYASEAPVFPPALTVREALGYYARLHVPGAARRALVHDAIEMAGLGAVAQTWVAGLGRADLGRLAIAQAALGGRRVVLLDETLSGLDPRGRRDLAACLGALAAAGVAILLAAREVAPLERLANRVMVLRAGRIVRATSAAALLSERVLEVVLDAPPAEAPPGFRVTAVGLEASLVGRTPEAALALCRVHRLPVRASRVRVKSLEEIVLDADDGAR